MNLDNTFFLFARPSFFEGIARVVDLSGSLQVYNESVNEVAADTQALKNDWLAVGADMRVALQKYDQDESNRA